MRQAVIVECQDGRVADRQSEIAKVRRRPTGPPARWLYNPRKATPWLLRNLLPAGALTKGRLMLALTRNESGTCPQIKPDERFEIRLEPPSGTGYRWTVEFNKDELSLIADTETSGSAAGGAGDAAVDFHGQSARTCTDSMSALAVLGAQPHRHGRV